MLVVLAAADLVSRGTSLSLTTILSLCISSPSPSHPSPTPSLLQGAAADFLRVHAAVYRAGLS